MNQAFHRRDLAVLAEKNRLNEIPMIRISPTEMNLSSWLFHLAAKDQIIYR